MGISRDSKHKRRATGGKRKIHRKKRKYELGRPAAMTRLGTKRIHLVRCRGGMVKHRALKLDHGNFSWASEAISKKTRILVVVYNASNNELVRTNTLVKNSIIQIDATPFRQFYEQRYGSTLGKVKAVKPAAAGASSGADAAGAAQPKAEAKTQNKDSKPEAKKAAGADKKAAGADKKASTDKKSGADKKGDKKGAATADKQEEAKPAEAPTSKSDHVKAKVSARRNAHPVLDPLLSDQFSSGRLYACISSRPGQCGRADGYILEGEELAFYLRKLKK